MADSLYTITTEMALDTGLGLLRDVIKLALIDTDDYTFDPSHENFADIPPAAIVGAVTQISSASVAAGVYRASTTVVPNVIGDSIEALVIYNETLDRLIAYMDGFSLTPDASDIAVTWDATNGIIILTLV